MEWGLVMKSRRVTGDCLWQGAGGGRGWDGASRVAGDGPPPFSWWDPVQVAPRCLPHRRSAEWSWCCLRGEAPLCARQGPYPRLPQADTLSVSPHPLKGITGAREGLRLVP